MPTIPTTSSYYFTGTHFNLRPPNPVPKILAALFCSLILFPTVADSQSSVDQATYIDSLKADVAAASTTRSATISPLSSYIQRVNKKLTLAEAREFASYIQEAAHEFNLDVKLLAALIKVESRFDPDASNMGAKGLTQVIPSWHLPKIAKAREKFKVYSIFEPRLNVYVGAQTLRESIDNSQNVTNALLRYNGSLADPKKAYALTVLAEVNMIKL